MSETTVGRFAPTPSGRMHLGNLFCALLAWLSARSVGGHMVLRIEDLDPQRSVPAWAKQIEADLAFLGLDWDEGGCRGGFHGPYRQSERTDWYAAAYRKLEERGLVYPCFCSRAELHAASAPHAADGETVYTGRCRGLTASEIQKRRTRKEPAMRLRVPDEELSVWDGHVGLYRQNLARDCGDVILRRADGVYAYQLAVVVDDAAMGITQVVRGMDLLSSTPRQLYLYRLLGLPEPTFCHLPLLLAPDGRRLSKREADLGLDALQERGFTGEEIIGRLAYLAGLLDRPEAANPRELMPLFSWDKVPREDIPLPPGLFGGADGMG